MTALLPGAAAGSYLWLFPVGCESLSLSPAIYRWTCLWPGLMVVVPVAGALVLPIGSMLNRRLPKPFPDGWLVSILVFGVLVHVLLMGAYLVALEPGYRGAFLLEAIAIPQPFVAGAATAACFRVALFFARRRDER